MKLSLLEENQVKTLLKKAEKKTFLYAGLAIATFVLCFFIKGVNITTGLVFIIPALGYFAFTSYEKWSLLKKDFQINEKLIVKGTLTNKLTFRSNTYQGYQFVAHVKPSNGELYIFNLAKEQYDSVEEENLVEVSYLVNAQLVLGIKV
jgi:hypothetical protein